MLDSYAYQLIATLPEFQHKEFRKWLVSPFFNERKEAVILYDYLLQISQKTNPNIRKKWADKITAWNHVFANEKTTQLTINQENKLRGLLYIISENIKKYYAYKGLDTSVFLQHQLLATQLKTLHLTDFLEREMKDWQQDIIAETYQNTEHFQHQAEFYKHRLEIDIEKNNQSAYLQDYFEHRLCLISSELMQLYALLHADSKRRKIQYDQQIIANLLAILEKGSFQKPIFLQVYMLYINMLRQPTEENWYWQFKTLLLQHQSIFNAEEQSDLFRSAINYCIPRLNQGNKQFTAEAFFWSNENIERKYGFDNGILSPTSFKNTLRLGLGLLRSQQLTLKQWNPKDFIEKNKIYLPEKQRDMYANFAYGLLFFKEKKYNEALEKLREFKPQDTLHRFDVQRTILAIHYETGENDLFQKQKEKLLQDIDNQTNIEERYKVFNRNFIAFLEKIEIVFAAKGNKNKSLKAIAEEIKNEKNVADKDWLLECLK